MSEWITCANCMEEWPADAFKAAGTSFLNRKRVCGACYEDLYPRRYVPCTRCGKKMTTRGKFCEPMCRPCRRHLADPSTPPPPTTCAECGSPFGNQPARANGICGSCYMRQWRAAHGVNGKQTIGAWEKAA